jgi:hypothetical protein
MKQKKLIKKILVLTHGQNILKEQFYSRFTKLGLNKKLSVKYIDEYKNSDDICISLPQSYRKLKKFKFDLIVIDEAHHFFFENMVQTILKDIKPKYVLPMTGSISGFIRNTEYPIVSISTEELLANKVICNPKITISKFNWDLKDSDYTRNDFVRQDTIFEDKFIRKVLKEHQNCFRSKTMIICNDVAHQRQCQKALSKMGISSLITNYKTDKKSENLSNFKSSKEKVLLVVRRGVLGYDLNSLRYIIDFSGSMNVDFLYQAINRVTRLGLTGKKFIKVCDDSRLSIYYAAMSVACSLIIKEYYLSYEGSSQFKVAMNKNIIRGLNCYKSKNSIPLEFDLDVFKRINESKNGEYVMTSLSEIKSAYYSEKEFISIDQIVEVAKRYKKRIDMRDCPTGKKFYKIAQDRGELERVFKMANIVSLSNKKGRTIEDCIEKAKLYKKRGEFKNSIHSSYYKRAQRMNWLDIVCEHMNIVVNEETTLEALLKCSSWSEFTKGNNAKFYRFARENNLTEKLKKSFSKEVRSYSKSA